MSLNRMRDILRFMGFDNKVTRSHRQSQDKFAAFRDVWFMFIQQLPKFYTHGSDITTVDEQLVAFGEVGGLRHDLQARDDALRDAVLEARVHALGRLPDDDDVHVLMP